MKYNRFQNSRWLSCRRWRVWLLSLLWLAARLACPAEEGTDTFEAANRLYEKGDYTNAVHVYEQLLSTNRASAAVFFNLGNAWFKSGQVGRAVVAYRKAQQLSPRDPDVRANLQFAREQVQGPRLSLAVWERWLGRATLNEWTLMATGAFWLLFIVFAAGQWRPGLARGLRWLAWAGAVGTVVFGLCAAAAFSLRKPHRTAVVIAPGVVVRHGPLDESSTAFTAHDGAELKLLDRKDDWLRVSDGKKNTGWLRREQVLVL